MSLGEIYSPLLILPFGQRGLERRPAIGQSPKRTLWPTALWEENPVPGPQSAFERGSGQWVVASWKEPEKGPSKGVIGLKGELELALPLAQGRCS